MRKMLIAAAVAFAFSCLMPVPAAQAALSGEGRGVHRIGLGVNYWKTLEDLGEDFDEDGFSYLLSYQYAPAWFVKVGTNLEVFPELANSTGTILAPELFVTFGGLFYGGVGVGIYYNDATWSDAPFYMFRAGFDIPVLPRLFIDLNANYRFNDWKTLEWSDLDTDTIRLGVAVRFVL